MISHRSEGFKRLLPFLFIVMGSRHDALMAVLWALPFPAVICLALRLVALCLRPTRARNFQRVARPVYERISTMLMVLALVRNSNIPWVKVLRLTTVGHVYCQHWLLHCLRAPRVRRSQR